LWWRIESDWVSGGSGEGSGEGSGGGEETEKETGGWKCDMEFVEQVYLRDLFPSYIWQLTGNNIILNPTGTKLYVYSVPWLVGFNLNPAYNLSSISLYKALKLRDLLAAIYGRPWGISQRLSFYFKQDGTILYVSDANNFHQFNLSVPWDITTVEYTGKSFSGFNVGIHTFCFNPEGAILYVRGYYATGYGYYTKFYQCSLSTPWDISTVSLIEEIPILNSIGGNFQFRPDGRILYSHGYGGYHIYTLTTPWDAKTALPTGICSGLYDNSLIPNNAVIYNYCFSNNGLYYFVAIGYSNIYKFAVKK
jgi:hypothetical protein